jgi:DNA polymerase III sliding clamp (beta) subunit (PCNA family)
MITKEHLAIIGQVTKKTPATKALPILQTVRFEPGKITATNLETAVIITDPSITETGFVDGAKLKKSGLATIQKHWGLVNKTDFDAADWPELPTAPEATTEVSPATINAITSAIVAVSTDDTRPVITGVKLKDNGTVTGTDGYRLMTKNGGHKLNMLMTGNTARLIQTAKTLNGWTVGYTDKLVTIKNGNMTIIANQIDGNYPEYEPLLPSTAEHFVKVEAAKLYEALDLLDGGASITLSAEGTVAVEAMEDEKMTSHVDTTEARHGKFDLNQNNMHIIMPLKSTSSAIKLNTRYVKDAVGKAKYINFSYSSDKFAPVTVSGSN